jgi:hypothetical protein
MSSCGLAMSGFEQAHDIHDEYAIRLDLLCVSLISRRGMVVAQAVVAR